MDHTDEIVATGIVVGAILTILTIIFCTFNYHDHRNKIIGELVKEGHDPIAAACALGNYSQPEELILCTNNQHKN